MVTQPPGHKFVPVNLMLVFVHSLGYSGLTHWLGLLENSQISLVHLGKLLHVCYEDVDLDDLVQTRSCFFKDSL